jgi:O-antigen/teichoic acid export membrane protein|tara:strand:+ start:1163 stop:2647 length:1485 start_codon:yes stop_codon:yes gene_type:complete
MGIVINQSIKNSLSFYFGMFLGAISTVFVYPNVFNDQPDHWGLIQLIVAYSFIISTFSNFGVPKTFIRFFPIIENKSKFYFFSFLLITIGYLLFLILALFFEDWFFNFISASPLLIDKFYLIYFMVLIISVYELFVSISRSNLNSTLPTFLNEAFLKSYSLIVLILHGLKILNFDQFLFFYVGGYLMKLIIIFISQFNTKSINLIFSLRGIKITELIQFGLFVIVGGASAMLVSRLDMVMIGKFMGLKHVAFYSVAFYVGNAIRVPGRAVVAISAPIVSKAWKNNDLKLIKDIYYKSSINQLIIGGIFFVCVWLSVDDIFSLLPEKFSGGRLVVFFIGLSQLFNVAMGVNGAIILNSKYYRFDLYANLFLLAVTFLSNYLFIPDSSPLKELGIVGINGAAFATALSIFLFNFIKFVFIYVKVKLHPFDIKTLYSILLLLFVYYVVDSLSLDFNPYLNILLNSSISLIIFVPILLYTKLSLELLSIYNNFKNRLW